MKQDPDDKPKELSLGMISRGRHGNRWLKLAALSFAVTGCDAFIEAKGSQETASSVGSPENPSPDGGYPENPTADAENPTADAENPENPENPTMDAGYPDAENPENPTMDAGYPDAENPENPELDAGYPENPVLGAGQGTRRTR